MQNSAVQKATITRVDPPTTSIECLFNPKEYSISKQNQWKEGQTPAHNVTQLEFGGGKPSTLQLQLFFDTTKSQKDVRREYTDKIMQLMLIDSRLTDNKNKKGRPPRVMFIWGSDWKFQAVITSIKQQFTLFTSAGVPLRATLDVTFQEVKDSSERPAQNPTSGGVGGERIYQVTSGDTLSLIAYRYYGDSNKWRLIADANRMTRVRELAPGMTLVIPNE